MQTSRVAASVLEHGEELARFDVESPRAAEPREIATLDDATRSKSQLSLARAADPKMYYYWRGFT